MQSRFVSRTRLLRFVNVKFSSLYGIQYPTIAQSHASTPLCSLPAHRKAPRYPGSWSAGRTKNC